MSALIRASRSFPKTPVSEEDHPMADIKIIRITDGNQVGGNLFFSVQEFSVPFNGAVLIEVDPTVINVFLRVTSSKPSVIQGQITLRQPNNSISSANFFLINSNSIIFGPNASLALGSSFITTTAASINFEDGFQFGPGTSEVAELTDSSPVALQFGDSPGPIVNQSFQRVQDDSGKPILDPLGQRIYGLSVAENRTLALVGGDIVIAAESPKVAAGRLTAITGRIEVGSVVSADLVNLTPVRTGWALGYEKVQKFGTIELADGAVINSSGGGAVQVQGREITLTGLSQIFSVTAEGLLGEPLQVSASDSITVRDGLSSIRTETEGPNTAGNVEISTGRLAILKGGRIGSVTLAEGSGGDVRVRADSVTVSGVDMLGGLRFPSLLYVLSLGSGAPGTLIIDTTTPPDVSEGGTIVTGNNL
jgi:filamentous hemagglutinin family protein